MQNQVVANFFALEAVKFLGR